MRWLRGGSRDGRVLVPAPGTSSTSWAAPWEVLCGVLAQIMPGDVSCVPSMALCSRRSCWKGPLQTGVTEPLEPMVGWGAVLGLQEIPVLDCTHLMSLKCSCSGGDPRGPSASIHGIAAGHGSAGG